MVTTRHDTLRQRVAQIWKTSAIKRVLGSDFSPLWKLAERMTNCRLSSRSMVRIHQGASPPKASQSLSEALLSKQFEANQGAA